MEHALRADLDHILEHTESLWRGLGGSRIFLTGGTGFFGIWILETVEWARRRLGITIDVTVLSRAPAAFLEANPQFQGRFTFHPGNITDFSFPSGEFTHVLHAAATPARDTFHGESPLRKFDTLVQGTRRVLDFAVRSGAKHVWFTSSGAVYGRQPMDMLFIPEEYAAGPEPLDWHSALGQGKRAAEFLFSAYAAEHALEAKVARCFSFVGPGLPLDIHYAVGNFIGDALGDRPVQVRGTGQPVRSYLYAADLVIWLLHVFCRGRSLVAYNVGSEEACSIASLAKLVSDCAGNGKGVLAAAQPLEAPRTAAPDLYVPSTKRARTELCLKQWIPLEVAIRRTIHFHRERGART